MKKGNFVIKFDYPIYEASDDNFDKYLLNLY